MNASSQGTSPCRKTHNILVLENELVLGGLEKKIYDLVSRIDRRHYRVVICCLKAGGHLKKAFLELGTPFYDCVQKNKYDVFALRRLRRIVRDEKIDLLYTTPHANTLLFTHLLRRFRQVKRTVVSIHATTSPVGGPLFPGYQKPLLQDVDRFIAVARAHARHLIDNEGLEEKRIAVIHNGVDTDTYRPGPPREGLREALGIADGERVITTVASLKPLKGIDLLLRAAGAVLGDGARARFVIVGDGPQGAAYAALAGELGITSSVTFAGLREDVDDVLRASDIFVLPSRTEAFPNVVLEAMSTGLPVVATDVGSVRELVEDGRNGLVVPPEDAAALAQAMRTLLSDDEKRRKFGGKGRDIADTMYRLDGMVAARERLFQELLCND